MLRTLTNLLRGRRDSTQLELVLADAAPKNADELLVRLRSLGLTRLRRCRLTRNRNVMVSFGGEELRVHEGYLGAPWLGDEMSMEVRDFYNRHVMDSSDGPYAALIAYEAELLRVRDTLQQMEDEYRRTEGDNAELWGRL